jgi:DNA-directed RNA polymerase subunit RPC12/RpoP
METRTLDGHNGRSVTIDLCRSCQAFWFDPLESLSLTPGSTLALFRTIGEQPMPPAARPADASRCPRCRTLLLRTRDMQRDVRFEYWSCPGGHGRFTSFFDFLREKNFIRPLSPQQIAELRQNVQTVNCSNCGAAIDLASGSACAHCGSPLSMLDMKQAGLLVSQLQKAADRTQQPPDPSLPLELARARRDVEHAFAQFEGDDVWMRSASSHGLVWAGLNAIARWMKDT